MNDNKKIDEIMSGDYHTVNEVCKILNVSKYIVFKWFNMGALSHFSLSERRTVVIKSELKRFLNERCDLLSKRRK